MYFLSIVDTEMAWVVEILPCGSQGPMYHTLSLPWLLIPWLLVAPCHQQPWYLSFCQE